jgi:S4 domain
MGELIHLPAVLADQFGVSRSEARRVIVQGGVKLNGKTVTEMDVDLDSISGGEEVAIEMGRTRKQFIAAITDAMLGREELCPMGCGRMTDDVYGGPCSTCWDQV